MFNCRVFIRIRLSFIFFRSFISAFSVAQLHSSDEIWNQELFYWETISVHSLWIYIELYKLYISLNSLILHLIFLKPWFLLKYFNRPLRKTCCFHALHSALELLKWFSKTDSNFAKLTFASSLRFGPKKWLHYLFRQGRFNIRRPCRIVHPSTS